MVGTSSGAIAVYNWDWFGDCKDRITGHPEGVECMLGLNEGTVITGCEDGWVRIVGLYPHSVNLFQKHAEDLEESSAVCQIDMNHDCRVLASIAHDCSINFYDLTGIWDQVENAENGEKIQLEEDKDLNLVKNEMNKNTKNKEKQEKTVGEKKKKADFFKDF